MIGHPIRSHGDSTRIAHVVAQRFTHLATSAYLLYNCFKFALSFPLNLYMADILCSAFSIYSIHSFLEWTKLQSYPYIK